jgi:hypothetical protein
LVTVNLSTPQRHLSRSPFSPQAERPIEQFEVDDRVTHAQHGLGRVIAQEPSGVTVDFGSQRVWIASPYPRLHKL